MIKMRLDKFIFEKFSLKSRTFAENLIIKGKVCVNGKICRKPSFDVSDSDAVNCNASDEFASLGGDKLNKALSLFNITLNNKKCVDIGASNGGFTDCMLRNGAKLVYAVDVAACALPDILKKDNRVVVKDNLNAREIKVNDIDGTCDFLSADVSFISLTLVIPACSKLLKEGGECVLLIKPQFEMGKRINKSGIVNNAKDRLTAVNAALSCAKENGLSCVGVTTAPKNFENKNIEYPAYFVRGEVEHPINCLSLEKLNEL